MAQGAADFVGPPLSDEDREKLNAEARLKYGVPFSMLKEDEKAAMYRDYVGERDVQNAEYMQGQDMYDKDMTKGIQAGDVYVGAGAGNAIAELFTKYQGVKKQKSAKEKLAGLSKDYQKGSQAAGDVARHRGQQDTKMIMALLKNRQASNTATQTQAPQAAAPQQAPPVQPAPPPQQPQPAPPPQAGSPQFPGGQTPRQQMNSGMAQRMQSGGRPGMGMGIPFKPLPKDGTISGISGERAKAMRRREEEERLRALGIMP